MPTVLRAGGFHVAVLFAPREHLPAHVHVTNSDGLAVIRLAQDEIVQVTMRIDRMKRPDVARAERLVRDNSSFLLNEFRRLNGKTR
jgi:hypothetical protein